jgi:hypothetical protein
MQYLFINKKHKSEMAFFDSCLWNRCQNSDFFGAYLPHQALQVVDDGVEGVVFVKQVEEGV